MPMMARATHSQLKKLKKLMTEKMLLEKAYSRVMTHCIQEKKKKAISRGSRQTHVCYNTKYRYFRRTICQDKNHVDYFLLI